MIRILQAQTATQLSDARTLFLEYAESLGFSLCFQDFDRELAELPGDYAPPWGRLLIAYLDGEAVCCAALHRLEEGVGEMKRLYVKPSARGHGIGRMLSERIIAEARAIGYTRLRLDTVAPRMQTAVAIYRSQGFVEILPYRVNPIEGALYMEKDLTQA
jgi:putative acetyltransferase